MKKLARKLGEGMHAAAARSSKSCGDSKNSANQKKDISQKRNRTLNNTSGSKKKSRQQTKTKHRPSTYVGIDLHKKTLQIEVQDSQGNVMYNKKIRNTALSIRREFRQNQKNRGLHTKRCQMRHRIIVSLVRGVQVHQG